MDDFFKSVKTTSDSLELQQQLVVMLNRAGFNLTKWVSNVKEAIERIPESERAPSIKVVEEEIVMPVERALGVIWDTRLDCFVYKVPIGFLAPFLVRAKLLLQQVWQFGIGWDETPPSEFLLE